MLWHTYPSDIATPVLMPYSIRFRLMLFRALLVLLIPKTTVNCAITYSFDGNEGSLISV